MSIARIKQDAERADQMIAEMGKQPAAGADTTAQDSANDVGAEEAVVVDQGDAGAVDQGVVVDTGAAPSADETGTDTVEELREQLEKSEQRYRSLDGMIRSRDKQINQLHELLAAMQQQGGAPRSAPAGEDEPAAEVLVNAEDEKAFGSDLVDMARRAAREEGQRVLAAVQRELAELKQVVTTVSSTTADVAKDKFHAQLDKAAPDWRTLDTDPAFIDWLQASMARQRVFGEGVQTKDVEAVAYLFNEFAKMQKPAVVQAPVKDARAQQLERQVAPGKSRTTGTPVVTDGAKKTWTRSEIASAYANKKQYAADEFARMERDIAAAQREGRVDYSR